MEFPHASRAALCYNMYGHCKDINTQAAQAEEGGHVQGVEFVLQHRELLCVAIEKFLFVSVLVPVHVDAFTCRYVCQKRLCVPTVCRAFVNASVSAACNGEKKHRSLHTQKGGKKKEGLGLRNDECLIITANRV